MQTLLILISFTLSLFAGGPPFLYYVSPTGAVKSSCSECKTIGDPCQFQYALSCAQTTGYDIDSTIYVMSGTYHLSGTSLEYNITKDYALTIMGDNAATTVIEGDYTGTLMRISKTGSGNYSNATVSIGNLTFLKGGGDYAGNGLFVYTYDSNISIERCRFIDNSSSDGYGGGAYLNSYYGSINVLNSMFRDNQADAGGALFISSYHGTIAIKKNEFSGNSVCSVTEHNGGGVYSSTGDGTVTIMHNIFEANTALENGGGLYSKVQYAGTAYITSNTFVKNSAELNGGGVYACMSTDDTATTHIYNNIIWSNHSATATGNDVYINNSGDTLGAKAYYKYNLFGSTAADFSAAVPAEVESDYLYSGNPMLLHDTLSDGRRSLLPMKGSPAIGLGYKYVPGGVDSTDFEGRYRGTPFNLGAVERLADIPLAPVYYLLMN